MGHMKGHRALEFQKGMIEGEKMEVRSSTEQIKICGSRNKIIKRVEK